MKHLGEIKEKPSEKPFGEITAALRRFKNPTDKDVTDLEVLRMKYGETLEANHLEHKMEWHREVRSVCPTAPRVE